MTQKCYIFTLKDKELIRNIPFYLCKTDSQTPLNA